MTLLPENDRGVSLVWIAVVVFFLMASTALAVDLSGGFNTARTDQTTADLACLAGVAELPNDPGEAINVTVDYVEENWPAMTGQSLSVTGTTASYTDGTGNAVFIDVAYDGDPSKEYVRVTEVSDTFFAKVIGFDNTTVVQEAWCRVEQEGIGGGGLPFGAQPGGFNGSLQKLNPCETGNCGPLLIPRDDASGRSDTLIRNIANGPDRILTPKLGMLDGSENACWDVSAGEECTIVETDTGVSASHLGEGMLQRLEEPGSACSFRGRDFNCDTPEEILGGPLTQPTQKPSLWNEDVHGEFATADLTNHFVWSGEIAKCDSPRLGFMPIVSEDMSWGAGPPWPPFPNGSKDVKVVGFYWVIIIDPNDANDWQGNGSLKQSSAYIIWLENPSCDGEPFDPRVPSLVSKTVLLVNDTN